MFKILVSCEAHRSNVARNDTKCKRSEFEVSVVRERSDETSEAKFPYEAAKAHSVAERRSKTRSSI